MPQTKTPIILIGGGGHCRSCIDVIEATQQYKIIGIVESEKNQPTSNLSINNYKIIGYDADLPQLIKQTPHCLITIGHIKSSQIRQNIYKKLISLNAKLPTIISPHAYVSPQSKLGQGTIIMHHALINANTQIGDNCIINSKALIEHDSKIGSNTHISTNAIINGGVDVGEDCFIGSNSMLKQGISLTNNIIIGASSTVLNSIQKSGCYVGVVK